MLTFFCFFFLYFGVVFLVELKMKLISYTTFLGGGNLWVSEHRNVSLY